MGQSGVWTVGLSAAQTLATVTTVGTLTTITNPVTISDGGPGGSISIDGSVGQSGTWTVGLSAAQTLATVTTVGTLTTITNPVTVSDGGPGGSLSIDGSVGQSGVWTVGLSAAQTLATVTTVGTLTTITNPVTISDGGTGGSITIDGTVGQSGTTWAVQDSQVVADNAGFTDGTTKLFMAGYIYDDVAGTALSENDAAAPRISVNRATIGVIEDGATRARYATVTTRGSLLNEGAVASAAANAGNPLKIGFVSASGLGTVAAGTTAQILDAIADTDGVQIVKSNCPFSDIITERLVANSAANQAFTKFNNVTGKRNYITTMSILNSSTTNTYVHFKDGNGGNSTIFFTAVAPAGGGCVITFPTPLRQPTTNTALNIEWDTAVASGFVSLVGFQSQQ